MITATTMPTCKIIDTRIHAQRILHGATNRYEVELMLIQYFVDTNIANIFTIEAHFDPKKQPHMDAKFFPLFVYAKEIRERRNEHPHRRERNSYKNYAATFRKDTESRDQS